MANLLAGRRVFVELLQDELRAERVAEECLRLLEMPPPAEVYEEIRGRLGAPGSQDRAAELILERFF
jgi:lipid A disaccharide synthetase